MLSWFVVAPVALVIYIFRGFLRSTLTFPRVHKLQQVIRNIYVIFVASLLVTPLIMRKKGENETVGSCHDGGSLGE